MEQVNTLVIGAGAVGLAIGYELSKSDPDLVIVEKETSFGKHTSSRNSEVIHAGLYYQTGSLKTRLCVEGNPLLYRYLEEKALPHNRLGKIIVATNDDELDVLDKYNALGLANGCSPLTRLAAEQVREMEPSVKSLAGLYIPSSGIFDTHLFMHSLAEEMENRGAFLVFGKEVTAIRRHNGGYLVEFADGEQYLCQRVINSGGLWSDRIAEMAGLDVDALGIRLHWCKGEYYKSSRLRGFRHLVYPVADPRGIYLGIHLTLNLNGEVRFGPNAYYVDNIDYRFNDEFFSDFFTAINRYLDVDPSDLSPDDTGVRPKLQGPADGFRDFYIREESSNGLPGFVNLIGIESPGLTASLAIGKYVASLIG